MLRSRLSSPFLLAFEAPRPTWEQVQYGLFAFLCAAGFASAAAISVLVN
jgi:hypothetical protein